MRNAESEGANPGQNDYDSGAHRQQAIGRDDGLR